MPHTLPSQTLSVTIDRDWREVYDYASKPLNLRHWAAGLGADFHAAGDEWVFRDPGGHPVRLRFTAQNPYGVLDHDVFPPGADPVHVAMRVMPNGDGAEVTFLLLRTPAQSDADYARDAAAVQRDLDSLKTLLER
jgi:hypothetical protein